MKFEQKDKDVFIARMEQSDASEDEIAYNMRWIRLLLDEAEKHGYSPDVRAADRGNYWRYAHVEKALMRIHDMSAAALMHIKFVDFPARKADPVDRSGHH